MDDKAKLQKRLEEIRKLADTGKNEANIPLAIDQCSELIKDFPDFWEPYRLRASLYERKKQFDEAAVDYNEVINSCPDDHPDKVTIYVAKGFLLYRKGEYEEIGDVINSALSQDPKNQRAFLLINQVINKIYKHNETQPKWLNTEFIEKVIERYEKQSDFDNKGHPLDSIDSMILPGLYLDLGRLYAKQGNHQKAIDKYKKPINFFIGKGNETWRVRLWLHKYLALSYLELGRYKEALTELDKVAAPLYEDSEVTGGRSESLLKLIEQQEKDFQERLETFLEGPDSIFGLREDFINKEKEYEKLYRNTNILLGISLLTTFITIFLALYHLLTSNSEAISQNSLFILPYLGITVLFAAVPAWWTRILLRSRDRWQILREDCSRKAAIMQYIKATGGNEEFRNQVILETIRHLANRGGADLLAGSQTDDHGMSYSIPDAINKTLKKN